MPSIAAESGFPVVLKLHSETITHKTDVGGAALNLATRPPHAPGLQRSLNQWRRRPALSISWRFVQPMALMPGDGYELILGSSIDAQFGPVLLFGTGGPLVEVY